MPDAFPAIAELLPHRGPAVLLDRVLAHDSATTVCAALASSAVLYAGADGAVPSFVGLELMAQAIAAHGGLTGLAEGREPRPGFFVGSRRLTFAADRFEPGDVLEVRATHVRGTSGILAFDCAVVRAADRQTMVSGILTVYLLDGFDALQRDFGDDDGQG